jgi:hypothetical protein
MLRGRLVHAVVAGLCGSLLAASAASADSVTGSGTATDRGWTYTVSIDASSGPHGEQASGTMSWISVDQNGVQREHWEGNVTCLNVRGARATAIGELTFADPTMHPGQGLALMVEDGGAAGADGVGVGFPRSSDLGGTCPNWAPFKTLGSGDLLVTDEDPDRVAPVVSIEGDLEVDAESPEGGWVTLRVTAVDDLDGPVFPWCDGYTGGLFPVGIHVITCFASDLTGNVGSSTVEFRVKGAAEQIADLRASVQALSLPAGHLRVLDEKLAKADAALAAGDVEASCADLLRFEREVGDVPDKKLTDERTLELQADAVRIRAAAGC